MFSKYSLVGLLCLFLVACGGEEGSSVKVRIDGKEVDLADAKSKTKESSLDPCGLLTVDRLAEVYAQDKTTITKQKSFGSNMCSYAWPMPNQEARSKENQERLMAHMKAQREALAKGEDPPKMNMLPEEATVSFNFTKMGSAENAAKAFERNLESLRKGITGESQGIKATFKINYDVEVSGLGNQAAWSSGHRQLAVQYKDLLLYINATAMDTPEDNLAKAKSLMQAILSDL